MNCLVFDIETVPDVEFGRRRFGLQGLEDAAIAKAMFAQQRAEGGSEFLPLIQHRVVAIACVLRTREQLRLIGSPNQVEAVMANIQKRAPAFVDR